MITLCKKQHKCLLEPLYEFGDHNRGFMGCLWCGLHIKCVRFNPTVGRSILFRDENFTFRLNKTLKKGASMALDSDQKQFIRQKVEALGDIEKVKQLYYKDCSVDNYANKVARKIFGERKKKND